MKPAITVGIEADETENPRYVLSLVEGTVTPEGGSPIALPGRELELLALLAFSRRPLSAEVLADAIWPHFDGDRARVSFKVYVCRVRTRLGCPAVLVSNQGRWSLGKRVVVDVLEWETLARAASSLPIMEPLRSALSLAYESLIVGLPPSMLRSHLVAQFRTSFESVLRSVAFRLIEDALARRDAVRAAGLARTMISVDPYGEAWHEALMRAYAQSGKQIAALRAHKRFESLLREELGDEASLAVTALAPEVSIEISQAS